MFDSFRTLKLRPFRQQKGATMKTIALAQEVTDSTFGQSVLQSNELFVVDFWAQWCGPCRMVSPVIDSLADEYQGKVKVGKMDIDTNPKTPAQFQIRSIPTVLFFKGGQVVDRVVGAQSREAFVRTVEKHLQSKG
jgi:thioredoxin 1